MWTGAGQRSSILHSTLVLGIALLKEGNKRIQDVCTHVYTYIHMYIHACSSHVLCLAIVLGVVAVVVVVVVVAGNVA